MRVPKRFQHDLSSRSSTHPANALWIPYPCLPAFTDNGRLSQDIANWSQTPEGVMLRDETTQYLQQAIAQLPPDYRVVIVLRDMEERSHREIGSMLELSISAVKSRLHRARLLLRHQLATYFASR